MFFVNVSKYLLVEDTLLRLRGCVGFSPSHILDVENLNHIFSPYKAMFYRLLQKFEQTNHDKIRWCCHFFAKWRLNYRLVSASQIQLIHHKVLMWKPEPSCSFYYVGHARRIYADSFLHVLVYQKIDVNNLNLYMY